MNKALTTLLLFTVIAVPAAAQTPEDKEDEAKRAVRREAIESLMQSHRQCLLARMDWQSEPCMIFIDHLVPNLPPAVKLTAEQEHNLRWGAYSNLSGLASGPNDRN